MLWSSIAVNMILFVKKIAATGQINRISISVVMMESKREKWCELSVVWFKVVRIFVVELSTCSGDIPC